MIPTARSPERETRFIEYLEDGDGSKPFKTGSLRTFLFWGGLRTKLQSFLSDFWMFWGDYLPIVVFLNPFWGVHGGTLPGLTQRQFGGSFKGGCGSVFMFRAVGEKPLKSSIFLFTIYNGIFHVFERAIDRPDNI